jgi:hypothetical protein
MGLFRDCFHFCFFRIVFLSDVDPFVCSDEGERPRLADGKCKHQSGIIKLHTAQYTHSRGSQGEPSLPGWLPRKWKAQKHSTAR